MSKRPKQYGGMSRGNDREREEQGRRTYRGPSQEPRRARPKRASESDVWEREVSHGRQNRDIDPLDERDELDEQDAIDRTR